ncbi:MAG: M16 family metallopeptidase [Propionibacteriaceae bacterium]
MTVSSSRAARAHLGGEIRRTVLPGGLRVVSETVPGSETFSLGFFVDVGSRHEQAPVHGAAHFLEHVLFKGTHRRTAEEIAIAIESVGGDINAYTAKEHTCFYAKVLGEDAPVAVDVVTDMLTDSLITAPDVESERAVILDEIAMHNDDPAEVAHENVAWQLFSAYGLGLPVVGSEQSITDLSRDQVAQYFSDHYFPGSIVVSAVGRVDHDQLCSDLVAFRPGVDPVPVVWSATEPYPKTAMVLAEERPLEQVTAVLGLRGVGQFDDRRHALSLLSLILGGGMSSRLFVEVRERRGLTYGIEAGETCYSDGGLWTVEWQSHPDRVAEILQLVRTAMFDVAEHGVTDRELARAEGQLRGQTLLAYESTSARMSRLGTTTLVGDERSVEEMLERTDQVGSAEISAVAADLFGQVPVLGLVGPAVSDQVQRRIESWHQSS